MPVVKKVKADKCILFLECLMNVIRSIDNVILTLNLAADKVEYHRIDPVCPENYCSRNTVPPVVRPDLLFETFVPKTCVQVIKFFDPDQLNVGLDSMRIFSMLDINECESEITELLKCDDICDDSSDEPFLTSNHTPNTHALHHSFDQKSMNDDKAYLIIEIRSLMQYARRFLIGTFDRQVTELLSLKLLFTNLPCFQSCLHRAPLFFHELSNFDLFGKYCAMQRLCARVDEFGALDHTSDYFGQGISRVIIGRTLGQKRVVALISFVIRPPDYTMID